MRLLQARSFSAVAGVLLIALAMAYATTIEPATDNGDFYRVLRTFSIDATSAGLNDRCIGYSDEIGNRIPKSPLSLLGFAFASVSKLMGVDCFSQIGWFVLLSALFWSGVLVAIRGLPPRGTALALTAATIHFVAFAPVFRSFYDEAFLLAFAPWVSLIGLSSWWRVLASAIIVFLVISTKSQAVFFAPLLAFLLFREGQSTPRIRGAVIIAVLIVSSGMTLAKSHGVVNAYNRLYNGLGWTAMNVSSWPARDFDARRDHIGAHMSEFPPALREACSPDEIALMGTSFWPTGGAMLITGTIPVSEATKDALWELGFSDYLACFPRVTTVGTAFMEVQRVYLRSDYTTPNIVNFSNTSAGTVAAKAHWAVLSRGAVSFLLLSLALGGLLFRRKWFALAIAYLFVLSPVFVFFGDGFYEFEKHLLIDFGFLLVLALAGARDTAEPDRRPASAPGSG